MKKRKRKRKIKSNKGYIFIIVILTSIIGYNVIMNNKNNVNNQNNENDKLNTNETSNEVFDEQKDIPAVSNANLEELNKWYLTLVNRNNKMPEDYVFTTKKLDSIREFDSRAIDKLLAMINAARKDGVSNIWAQSTYRSVERQEVLVQNSINKYMKEGYSKQEAEDKTFKEINIPGTSEHNLGLAVDFNTITTEFENTKAFKWLQENAENYGFILRYPKDKVDITMVKYEPWHYRYVSKEHAIKINDLDMCLEEYIEYLKGNI